MASLHNLAIAILRLTGHTRIAAALRHHARQPGRYERSRNAADDFAERDPEGRQSRRGDAGGRYER
ncbi:MAG TPA: hypothetical protein VKU77_03125 [Streptosporangiaceae bacterium]|nr:hypothetical protein [Streptosporangiaceae bacterium]